MTLCIISADERAAAPTSIKGVIGGQSGIGKTSLAWTLDAASTLFLDAEAGMLALEGWQGDSIALRDWAFAKDLACYIGGPNPARKFPQDYCQEHFDAVVQRFGDRDAFLAKYTTFFVDSITVASRLCFQWSKQQPEAFNAAGKPDGRGAYGLMGQEMVTWLTQLQHVPGKSVWLVGILQQNEDDLGRKSWGFQVEGGKTMRELPGIVDEVISMVEMEFEGVGRQRVFVCHTINPHGYPAKDRSGRLDMLEEPHLGKLMQKIREAPRNAEIVTHAPTMPTAETPTPQPDTPPGDAGGCC
jgi:hypothetical protein